MPPKHCLSFVVLLLVAGSALAFSPTIMARSSTTSTRLDASVGIYYGTVGGNTKICANHIMEAASAENDVTICEIEDLQDPNEFATHDALIIGAPTWNTGAPKERTLTGWDSWLYYTLPNLDLKDKKVALFGVGDQGDYPFNCMYSCSLSQLVLAMISQHFGLTLSSFLTMAVCDAVGELYSEFAKAGCDVSYGRTSTEGYRHVHSKAQVDEDTPIFLGLIMDENVQPDMSQPRAQAWISQLKQEGFF